MQKAVLMCRNYVVSQCESNHRSCGALLTHKTWATHDRRAKDKVKDTCSAAYGHNMCRQ